MSLVTSKKNAIQEAVTDVFIGALINFPLGFVVLWLAETIGILVTDTEQKIQLVIFQSVIFSLVAIVRKTYIRLYFDSRNIKKMQKTG